MTQAEEAILMKHVKNFLNNNSLESLGMLMVNGRGAETIAYLRTQPEINTSFPIPGQLEAAVNIKAYNLD